MTEKNSDDSVSQKTGSTYGMTDEVGIPPFLADVPALARLVWQCLDNADEPLTVADLADGARCSRRGARKALVDLTEDDLAERANPLDQKLPKYRACRPE